MSSPVEISNRAKSRLEALQAEISEVIDRQVSQREILERVVEREYDSKADLVNSFRSETDRYSEEWEPPTDEEMEAFFSGTSDWGFETSEAEIDEVLYGR